MPPLYRIDTVLVPVYLENTPFMNMFFGGNGGGHTIRRSQNRLFDVTAQQIADSEHTPNRGLFFRINNQAAFGRGLKLPGHVIDNRLAALEINKDPRYRENRLIAATRTDADTFDLAVAN